jgi:hypothetical protein
MLGVQVSPSWWVVDGGGGFRSCSVELFSLSFFYHLESSCSSIMKSIIALSKSVTSTLVKHRYVRGRSTIRLPRRYLVPSFGDSQA